MSILSTLVFNQLFAKQSQETFVFKECFTRNELIAFATLLKSWCRESFAYHYTIHYQEKVNYGTLYREGGEYFLLITIDNEEDQSLFLMKYGDKI